MALADFAVPLLRTGAQLGPVNIYLAGAGGGAGSGEQSAQAHVCELGPGVAQWNLVTCKLPLSVDMQKGGVYAFDLPWRYYN